MSSALDLTLVSGAGGWLGAGLVRALVQGLPEVPSLPRAKRVRALIHHESQRATLEGLGPAVKPAVKPGVEPAVGPAVGPAVEIVLGDLRRADDCRRFCEGASGAVLFHTAGVIHPSRIREFYDVNVGGTENLVNAAVEASLQRIVAVSSNSPFGTNHRRDELFDESSPYDPYMNYGRSKMQMELIVAAARDAARIETVLVRAPWFYGPGQPARQTLFFRMVRTGKVPIVGDGMNRRSMAYIDNLTQGLILAAAAPNPAPAYWVADERPYTMNEIVDTIEDLLERDLHMPCAHKRQFLPDVASAVALLVDRAIQGIGLYAQKIHVLSEMNKTIACDVSKARAELGYRPAIGLREGMRRSLQWCLDAGYPL
jgi:nucleoside-diphosphate-sugar epimerase